MNKKPKTEVPIPTRTAHPTIATIAAHMGLSRATVTHVLNGRATEQRIRPETQRRVLEVAQELGYRPNASARAIRAGKFGNIALIQSLLGQYLPPELFNGLTRAIADKDLHLVLTQVPDVVIDDETYLPHAMRSLSVDGVLINRNVNSSQPLLERVHQLRIPAIFLNVKQETDCIHPDDIMGGRMAAEYLLDMGHERIVYVDTDEPDNRHYSKVDRRMGYESAMAAAGRTPRTFLIPKRWETPGVPGEDSRIVAMQTLLTGPDRPTAVIAYELAEAMATVHAAHRLGLRIPQDLSLIQFHHWMDDRFFIPIQTVSNVMDAVGVGAVALLLEKIKDPDGALPARAVPVEMMHGATCAPPRR